MPKTVWNTGVGQGTFLTAQFQNTFYGTNAATGHTHDGLDQDGSAPPINLASNVTGTLP